MADNVVQFPRLTMTLTKGQRKKDNRHTLGILRHHPCMDIWLFSHRAPNLQADGFMEMDHSCKIQALVIVAILEWTCLFTMHQCR